ncbi:MAG: hypothetical protein JXB06_15210 [Spirochaetales bacterium]|nr:hypothetical protein [Spirochaetales bacterium]
MSRPLRSFYPLLLGSLILAGLLTAPTGHSQSVRFQGELGPGDSKLGRYFDTYPLQLIAGERIVASLSSYDFDACLLLESPEGGEIENDDYGEGSDARIDALVETSGSWKVKVSSYEEGEQGEYLLTVVRERLRPLQSHAGKLDEQDMVSVKGEYYDSYSVILEQNQRVVISMISDQFDPFLVVKPPRGRRIVNDDYEGESESRIDFIAESGGRYEVFATSYAGGERGEYSLRILLGQRMNVRQIDGYLDPDDMELEEHGYCEMHPLHLEEGQHVILEMTSEQLDTLLTADGPGGFYAENDDYNDQTYISRLEVFAPADGEYIITTAAYQAGVEGSYTLKIYSFGISGINLPNTRQLAPVRVPGSGRLASLRRASLQVAALGAYH